jgi:hypothetical protein
MDAPPPTSLRLASACRSRNFEQRSRRVKEAKQLQRQGAGGGGERLEQLEARRHQLLRNGDAGAKPSVPSARTALVLAHRRLLCGSGRV